MNRDYYGLFMDFAPLHKYHIYPGDLDMYFVCGDNYLVIGEAKLKGFHVKGRQKKALETIIDGHDAGGCLIEIEHNSRVQDGATTVDIADCLVRRAYSLGQWYEFNPPKLFLNVARELSDKHGGMVRI